MGIMAIGQEQGGCLGNDTVQLPNNICQYSQWTCIHTKMLFKIKIKIEK
jgi:hypothetical protein